MDFLKMSNDNLSDRMKKYEQAYDFNLTPNSCVIIRVDGKAFHTYTKDWYFQQQKLADKTSPFSEEMKNAMEYAMFEVAQEMQGFKLAYQQSDECTFLLTDFDTHETQGWFGYRLNKLISVTASMFTAHFNYWLPDYVGPAIFDARAFVVPKEDVANVFVWRQKDWNRNSLQMLARTFYSQKECHKKNRFDLYEMCEKVYSWENLEDWQKYGQWLDRNMDISYDYKDYDTINELIFN